MSGPPENAKPDDRGKVVGLIAILKGLGRTKTNHPTRGRGGWLFTTHTHNTDEGEVDA